MDMEKIQRIISDFSTKRDWEKFHNPKNLSMALSVEASELVEIFQWLDFEQAQNLPKDKKIDVKEELSDIAVYLIRMSMRLDIDLEEAIIEKMMKNEEKYPLIDSNGNKIEYGKKK